MLSKPKTREVVARFLEDKLREAADSGSSLCDPNDTGVAAYIDTIRRVNPKLPVFDVVLDVEDDDRSEKFEFRIQVQNPLVDHADPSNR